MARLRIRGTGHSGYGYQVFIDDKLRADVTRVELKWDGNEVNEATVTYVVDDLDIDTEVPEITTRQP
jgi:hypothetical protein